MQEFLTFNTFITPALLMFFCYFVVCCLNFDMHDALMKLAEDEA